MEEPAESSRSRPRRSSGNVRFRQLAKLLSTLAELLGSIDDDARLMDSNLDDAHQLVEDIRKLVTKKVFKQGGPLDISQYGDILELFEGARTDENVMYEVYAKILARYHARQRQDLGLAETDSDTLVLAQRRQVYLAKLKAFHAQSADILGFLRERTLAS